MASAGQFPKVAGDVIYGADYNAVHDIINTIMGQVQLGYGVVPQSLPVVEGPGTDIDAASWDLLRYDLDTIRTHQASLGSGLTDENPGMVVTAADINAYYNMASALLTNRYTNAGGTEIALVSGTSSTYATPWNTAISTQTTFTFSTAVQMSNFWAAGGQVTVTQYYTGSTTLSKDANWATLLNTVGTRGCTIAQWNTIAVGGSVVFAGPIYGSGVYASNYYQATLSMPSSTTFVITQTFADASIQSGSGGKGGSPAPPATYDENVTLSITASCNWYKSVGSVVAPVPTSVTLSKTLGP